MLNRLACFAVLLHFFVGTHGCALPSVSKTVGPQAADSTEFSVAVTGDQSRKAIPVGHEMMELSAVKQAPPLPNGYKLYHNLVFKIDPPGSELIRTTVTHPYIFTVKFLKGINEQDFKRLRILNLVVDELSPTYRSWVDLTVRPEPDKLSRLEVSQEKYEQALPNYAEKSISTLAEGYYCFAIAIKEDETKPSARPFTKIEVKTEYLPEHIEEGDKVNILITITNQGPRPAGVVSFDLTLDYAAQILSISMSQGTQSESTFTGKNTLFHLGALPVGASARVNLIVQAPSIPDNMNSPAQGKQPYNMDSSIYIMYKEHPNDLYSVRDRMLSTAKVFAR